MISQLISTPKKRYNLYILHLYHPHFALFNHFQEFSKNSILTFTAIWYVKTYNLLIEKQT